MAIGVKVIFTPEMDAFLISNYERMNNKQLADCLGLKVTRVRTRLYELGYKRMELEYWTEEQVQFLKDHYREIGDVELAEIFNEHYTKNKGWTKKHIEKKRRYLNLKRTELEKADIFKRNVKSGRLAVANRKRWEKTGVSEVGKIVVWRLSGSVAKYIKTETGFVRLSRYNYEKAFGKIPPFTNVCHKDGDPMNCEVDNLVLLDNAAACKLSADRMNDRYVSGRLKISKSGYEITPEIIEVKRLTIQLNRAINECNTNK